MKKNNTVITTVIVIIIFIIRTVFDSEYKPNSRENNSSRETHIANGTRALNMNLSEGRR
jgi:hypothetical protein